MSLLFYPDFSLDEYGIIMCAYESQFTEEKVMNSFKTTKEEMETVFKNVTVADFYKITNKYKISVDLSVLQNTIYKIQEKFSSLEKEDQIQLDFETYIGAL